MGRKRKATSSKTEQAPGENPAQDLLPGTAQAAGLADRNLAGEEVAAGKHESQLVIFVLANEHYAVGISAVDSIIKLQPITFVPRAPAFVEGVTNLRGKVLPVIDLRRRFGLPAGQPGKETRIVVTQVNNTSVGMVVDAVTEVLRLPEQTVEPPSPLVSTVDSAFITGIAKVEERLVILLDLEKVLSPAEKADLQDVSTLPVAQ